MKTFFHLVLIGCFVISLTGCSPREASVLSDAIDPAAEWDVAALSEHIVFLNSPESEGRGTGTRGFFHSANYVSARLKEYGLQPVLKGEYRQQVAIKLWTPDRIRIRISKLDTLNLVQGQDFILSLHDGKYTATYSPATVSRLREEGYRLTEDVTSSEHVTTGAMHVGGFIPGRHPRLRDSLVVVFAPLDGMGIQGLTNYSDGTDLGLGAAATLEMAHKLTAMQDRWAFFGPTVLVQFVSGTRQACQGPISALRNLPWDKSYVQRVIVLKDSSSPSCDWSQLARTHHVLAPVFTLEPAVRKQLADNKMPFYPIIKREKRVRTPDLSFLVDEAQRMSEHAMKLILNN